MLNDPGHDLVAEVGPDARTARRRFRIPAHAAPGDYDLVTALRTVVGGRLDHVLDRHEVPAALRIVKKPRRRRRPTRRPPPGIDAATRALLRCPAMDVLLLSPHGDDRAWSIGGLAARLGRRGRATLLTVFSRSAFGPGAPPGADVAAVRRGEDAAFAAACGLRAEWLDRLDAPLRGVAWDRLFCGGRTGTTRNRRRSRSSSSPGAATRASSGFRRWASAAT